MPGPCVQVKEWMADLKWRRLIAALDIITLDLNSIWVQLFEGKLMGWCFVADGYKCRATFIIVRYYQSVYDSLDSCILLVQVIRRHF